MEKIVELTKKLLNGKEVNNELKQELENELKKELIPKGKLSRLNELIKEEELDLEKYEFMLKLIAKDKDLYDQIDKLKKLKELKTKQTDLENISKILDNTREEIDRQIEGLELTTAPRTNIPVIRILSQKNQERKNKDILKTKLNLIISTIEESKLKSENKNLKEEYSSRQNLKDTLDMLYKHCELGNIDEIKELRKIIDVKYEVTIAAINNDIEKCSAQYRKERKNIEKCDARLREYVYQKKNNYITYAIEKLSKHPFIKYDENMQEVTITEPDEGYELIVYSLIALYELKKNEKTNIKITYISEKVKPNTTLAKNTIISKKQKNEKIIKK